MKKLLSLLVVCLLLLSMNVTVSAVDVLRVNTQDEAAVSDTDTSNNTVNDTESDTMDDDEYLKTFYQYLGEEHTNYFGKPNPKKIGVLNGVILFFSESGQAIPSENVIQIGDCIFNTYNIYTPYSLGVYAYSKSKIYTLEEAIHSNLFTSKEAAMAIEGNEATTEIQARMKYDLDGNYTLDMKDVVLLQQCIADLFEHPIINDQNKKHLILTDTYMGAVVNMQQKIAGLLD